jgi:preprotein translocase subunit YajC
VIVAGSLIQGSILAASKSSGSSWQPLILFAIIGVGMYFVFLRPQRNRMRRAQELQRELVPGQMVMTSGGLFGTVAAVDDDAVLIEVAPGVTTRWARAAVGRVISPEEALVLGRGKRDAEDESGDDADRGPDGDDTVR